jgi:hypothetical protein
LNASKPAPGAGFPETDALMEALFFLQLQQLLRRDRRIGLGVIRHVMLLRRNRD